MTSRAQEIVVLNGPAGVGKSTVSLHLRELVPGTVAIEGDSLRAFVPGDALILAAVRPIARQRCSRPRISRWARRASSSITHLSCAPRLFPKRARDQGCVRATAFTFAGAARDVRRARARTAGAHASRVSAVHECHAEIHENLDHL